jgi:hypothetical protein
VHDARPAKAWAPPRSLSGRSLETMSMDSGVTLPIKGGRLRINGVGFHLEPWLAARAVTVPWSNISFVCITPAVTRGGTEWQTFRGEPVTAETLRGGLPFYSFAPALKDRHLVASGHSRLARFWLKRAAWVRALVDVNGKALPGEGFMDLELSRRGIRRSPESLIRALDLIEEHSRFDLIVFDM